MTTIRHTCFFGDAEHVFCLSDALVKELEALTGIGVGALYLRVVANQFRIADLIEIIRLGLIGGGLDPQTAKRLTDTYAVNRPLGELHPLALDVLDARWSGKAEPQPLEAAQ